MSSLGVKSTFEFAQFLLALARRCRRLVRHQVTAVLVLGLVLSGALLVARQADAATGSTIQAIKERGKLRCTGVAGSYLGFSEVDAKGNWKGLDVDLCRALATAILGSPDKAEIVPVSWTQRFPALQAGTVDIILMATDWTFTRDTALGVQFSRPYFFGGTTVLVPKDLHAKTIADLNGGTLCLIQGGSAQRTTADYMASHGLTYKPLPFAQTEQMRSAFFSGRCDAMVGWAPSLAITRSTAKHPDAYMVLPQVMNLQPVAAGVRQGDDNFLDLVNWLLSDMLTAEQYGITSHNVDKHKAKPDNPAIARLLGVSPGMGKPWGLRDSWAYDVIKDIGNYGQVYARNLGRDSPYKLPQGMNALYTHGGLLYPLELN